MVSYISQVVGLGISEASSQYFPQLFIGSHHLLSTTIADPCQRQVSGLRTSESLRWWSSENPNPHGSTWMVWMTFIPKQSMYGIFPYIYHKNQPNVRKYTIRWWYGIDMPFQKACLFTSLIVHLTVRDSTFTLQLPWTINENHHHSR